MQAVATGDQQAFTSLFRRYYRTIFQFACRMTASPEAAEDLTQECFIRILRSAARFNASRGSLRVYLYTTARNLAIRESGKHRHDLWPDDEDSPGPADDAIGPEESVLRLEASEVVEKAVHVLPPAQKEVLILIEYQDLTLEEAAQVAGLDVGAVKSRLHRARVNLKKLLAPYFGRERMTNGPVER